MDNRPDATKLPADAEQAYKNAVKVDDHTYLAENGNGQIYRYFDNGLQGDKKAAHFTSIHSEDEVKKMGFGKRIGDIRLKWVWRRLSGEDQEIRQTNKPGAPPATRRIPMGDDE